MVNLLGDLMNLKNNYIIDAVPQLTQSELDDIMSASMTSSVYNTTGGSTISSNAYANGTIRGNESLTVAGTASFQQDISVKGRNIIDAIERIEKRLSILVPDPAKLAKYEALRKAYDQYKMLEALCDLPEKKDGQQ